MPKVLMTFDLEGADDDAYERGYEALVRHGLSRLSAHKRVRLPHSSVFGSTDVGTTAREVCDELKRILGDATECKVERVIVAVVDDWACNGKVDNDLWMQEIAAQFEADEGG